MAPGGSEVQLHVHLKVERCGVFHGHVCFPRFCKTCTHQLYQHRLQIAYGVTLWCISVHLKTVSFAPNHGIQQMMALSSTQQWHHVQSAKVGDHPWHPAMAPCDSTGTLLGTQQWHPNKSAKNGAHPPPIGSKNTL